MNNKTDYQTYLYISTDKLFISVKKNHDDKDHYRGHGNLESESKLEKLEIVNNFLNNNIFKIEKSLNFLVKEIFLIIEHETIFEVKISLKKKDFERMLISTSRKYLLQEAINLFKENYKDQQILHMLIEKYNIDNQTFTNLPQKQECNHLSIDVSFICLPKNFQKNLKKVFKTYQIEISQILSGKYIKEYFEEEKDDFVSMGQEIINGCNKNEVFIVAKTRENRGFFEKFFHFFK